MTAAAQFKTSPRVAIAGSFLFLLLALVAGFFFGSESVGISHLLDERDSLLRAVFLDARLPRVVLGAIAGGGLAATGVAFQAVLRNPLAEPFVLGVSGGAACGATIAMLFGLSGLTLLGASLVPTAALVSGMATTLLVYWLVRRSHGAGDNSILLAGVVVNAIASALITFLKSIVSALRAQELLFWLTGFLETESWTSLGFVGLYVAVGLGVLLFDAGRLNLLALGDDAASSLGVDVRRLERRTFFACSLVVGAIVSLTGLIGFVGLLVPHALRRILGPDVRVLLPASFLAGGGTLVLCDLLSRLATRIVDRQLQVGAITALLGGSLFLVLLRRRGGLSY